jgi:hypothetical protein
MADGGDRQREADIAERRSQFRQTHAADVKAEEIDPHAITVPTKMATRPAGMFFGYFTPPNQLARITAAK